MLNKTLNLVLFFMFTGNVFASCIENNSPNNSLIRSSESKIAHELMHHVLTLYDVPDRGLLSETYPVNPDHRVDYLDEGSVHKKHQEVSFLWPFSGALSGVVSLYANTSKQEYLDILENNILPGLEQYYDVSRLPAGYQSYPVFAGHSDRF